MTDPAAFENSRKRGFELTDAPARMIIYFSIGLVAVILLVLVVLWFFYRAQMGASPSARGVDAAAWSYTARELEGIEAVRTEMEEENRQRQESYAWVDRRAGIAQIPVDRAMEIILQEGLPNWRGESDENLQRIDLIRENTDER